MMYVLQDLVRSNDIVSGEVLEHYAHPAKAWSVATIIDKLHRISLY